MTSDGCLPALRPVDVFPFRHESGETYFALQDLSRISPQSIAVAVPGYFLLTQLDGSRTVTQAQQAFYRQFGQHVPADQIHYLVKALDEALLLQNARFEDAYADRRAAYHAASARDNRDRWPSEADLRTQIDALLATAAPAPRNGPVSGLIAPHLDYARGGPCYADAYAQLIAAQPCDRYVILGTNHFGRSLSVVATRKDFRTPLGLVPTDTGFIGDIEARLGESICEHELDHAAEHSIELQVHLLQSVLGDRPFEIVPVLCPDPSGPTGTAPPGGDGPDLGDFADTLAELVSRSDRRTRLIASADLSHVGQRFGESEPTTADFLAHVQRHDQRLLGLLEQRREEEFVSQVRAAENRTRICSVGCIYTLLRALPRSECRILRYHQAVDMPAETHVTCAAAVIS